MLFPQHDDMILALTPYRSDHTLSVWILPGRLRRSRNIFDLKCPHLPLKCIPECGVTISDQISRLIVDSAGLEHLACSPDGRRMSRDIEMQNPPSVMAAMR
jgi:hypothetical protein